MEAWRFTRICDYLRTYNWNDVSVYNLTLDSLWHTFCEVIDGAADAKLYSNIETSSLDTTADLQEQLDKLAM